MMFSADKSGMPAGSRLASWREKSVISALRTRPGRAAPLRMISIATMRCRLSTARTSAAWAATSTPRRRRPCASAPRHAKRADRKSTRLNSSHQIISYAVFCLKKKNCAYVPLDPAYTEARIAHILKDSGAQLFLTQSACQAALRVAAPTLNLTVLYFFFNDTATTEIYPLSLHDALPICSPSNDTKVEDRNTGTRIIRSARNWASR